MSENLIPGGHKLTKEERAKGGRNRARSVKRAAAFQKMFQMLKDLPAFGDSLTLLKAMGIPEDEQTVGMALAVDTFRRALEGDKDARRDVFRMSGEEPEQVIKEKEFKLRKKEAERKNPKANGQVSIFELMVKELYERTDEETEEVPD